MLQGLKQLLATRQSYRFFLRDLEPLLGVPDAVDVLATLRLNRRLEPVVMTGPRGRRIAVIAPHPDDEIIGPGGTLLAAKSGGARIRTVFLTCGRPGEERATRREEAGRVAERLAAETVFMDFDEGALPEGDASIAAFASAVMGQGADVIFIPFLLDDHRDHRDANRLLALAALKGLLPRDVEIWAYQVYTVVPSNVVVDITQQARAKAEAIALYRSEAGIRDWAHWALGLSAFNSRFLPRSPEPRYAELFFVLPAHEYIGLAARHFGLSGDANGREAGTVLARCSR